MKAHKKFDAKSREKQLKALEEFRFIDDTFMKVAFQDKACVKCVLDTILEADLTIIESHVELVLTNLHGGDVKLDVFAKDENGSVSNIEVQKSDSGAQPKRARRNSSFLDANQPDPGKYGENLRRSYVIFITEGDPLGGGLPIYHINRTIKETGTAFNDEAHIIYVTAKIQDVSTSLGRLMHDFTAKSASEMYNPILADRMRQLKEMEEGQETMCRVMEKLIEDVSEDIREYAREETKEDYILKASKNLKLSPEDIAAAFEVNLDYVKEVLAKNE